MSDKRSTELGRDFNGLNHPTAAPGTGILAPSFTDPANGDTASAVLNRMMLFLEQLPERIDRIEKSLALSVVKETYTTEEVAERLSRSEWTVRQWCNKGQVHGARKVHGRGRQGEWRIPHEELVRLQNEGLLPISQRVS